MEVIKNIKQLRSVIKEWKKSGYSIGFVPTMGYLHEGHESLIQNSVKENDKTVVSIFVNPTQFGPNEDLDKYPRDMKRDEELCLKNKVDIIFSPEVEEMYSKDSSTVINMNNLTKELCGKSRPNHFSGVCLIVTKLFNIVNADRAYFGEKDAQQLAIIKRMVKDLNIDIEIVGCPIIREEDGLAKSSRNSYLSKEERKSALILNKALKAAKENLLKGEVSVSKIKDIITTIISSESLARIDYIEVVDSINLEKVDHVDKDILVAIAVYIGKTRLIDNFTYKINKNNIS